jgi:hypothetical protein
MLLLISWIEAPSSYSGVSLIFSQLSREKEEREKRAESCAVLSTDVPAPMLVDASG